jgi:hypothetical protein
MSDEIWKPIAGFDGIYLVSSIGRIYSIKSKRVRSLARDKDGYLFISLYKNNHRPVARRVHHLVAEAFICPRPKGKEMNHKNGMKNDNRIENLEWVTRSENELHAYRELGFVCKFGVNHHSALLSPDAVRHIRSVYIPRKYTQETLAKELGVSRQTISDVLRGKKWKHVI